MEVLDILKNVTNFEEAKNKLKGLNLIVKEYPEKDLYLVKYDKKNCDMTDKDIQKCRGLIARMSDNKLVCLPPTKSLDIDENIEWKNIRVEDFVDGTMISVFYNNDEWIISTRSTIGAKCKWSSNKLFEELFEESNKSINFDLLDKTLFYTFVLIHPENIIVTKYTCPNVILVSVGTVTEDNKYKNLKLDNIKGYTGYTPVLYRFNSYEEAKEYVKTLSHEKQGLVLKYGDNLEYRSKIRNSNYNYVKSLKGNTNNLRFLFFELLESDNIKDHLTFFPENTELFLELEKKYNHLVSEVFKYYRLFHIKKQIKIEKMPYLLRPLCYEIHNLYIENKKNNNVYITTYNTIYNYLLSIPIPRVLSRFD